ncbi:MAG TPA: TPM domain-containing protein, partial [Xanthomonadaceae bacterium]|nr:TPM domain-containing protein [Xanthomonadaceae bacterium]
MAGIFARALSHLGTGSGVVHRRFDGAAMARIRDAIVAAELGHAGEIRFAVDAALPLHGLWHQTDPRTRAVEVFSQLRVWDTESNTGVLLYLLWADRAIEIVADRGVAALVSAQEWEAVCIHVREGLWNTHPADAVIAGITKIGELLRAALPAQESTQDELPD